MTTMKDRPELEGLLLGPPSAADILDWLDQHHGLRQALRDVTAVAEIAAVLEMQGLNDDTARRALGLPGIFALAELLERSKLLRPQVDEAAPATDGPLGHPPLLVVNGLFYVLPCLVWLAALPRIAVETAQMLLVVCAAAWGLTQGVSHIIHRLLNRGDLDRARRFAAACLLGGVALSLVLWGLSAATASGVDVLLRAGSAILLYGVASTVLFVLGGRWNLGLVIATSVLMAAAAAGLPDAMAQHVSLGAAVVLTAGATVMAATRTGWQKWPGTGSLATQDVRGGLIAAGYGVLCAVVSMTPTIASLGGTGAVAWTLWALPVVATMGVAEQMLLWFHSRMRATLVTAFGLRAFRRSLAVAIALSVAPLLAAIIVVDAAVGLLHPIVDLHLTWASVFAALLLGLNLVLGGLLTSLGSSPAAVLGLVPGAALMAVGVSPLASALPLGGDPLVPVVVGSLGVTAVALAVLTWHSASQLGRYR
jgi:hypothetical protein